MPKLPSQLIQSLNKLEHFNEKAFTAVHEEENKVTSIRLNPFKKVSLDFKLDESVKWNSQGYYLNERPSFTLDPLFQAGCYYPQEAGSMFIEFCLKQTLDFTETLKILDVCAAPGGKSTLINSLLNKESLLVANELIKSRADVLVQNLSKWGTCNTIVTNNDPQRFAELPSFFDAVVIDAPCSGSGLFRKQPDAIDEWSVDHVKACGIRQKKIVSDVLPALKEDGILIYSTCSYSEEENEKIVSSLVNEHNLEFVRLPIDKDWGILETQFGYRFYPHLLKSEGFFCAVLRKKECLENPVHIRKKNNVETNKVELEILGRFINSDRAHITKKNNQFHLLNAEGMGFLTKFEKTFYFKKAGMVIGEIKGRDMVPNQELAWFTELNMNTPIIELDKETSLKFLRKENFNPPKNVSGLVLLRYKEQGLGWAKILPNRINNYLPNSLRILK
ncbi:methyltransferase RsmF C-terminal domain-like protein [Aurantibacillus circumpalustris]|uniref:methyltransferase RsmF C-terminal domain-like protein n=1 Tax=Aurantibacillus circumpalustris TaxID=3036359 RepID=UPI00295AEBED|nr:RNA methyltransferase [Aurantibacillus circumpalustris]